MQRRYTEYKSKEVYIKYLNNKFPFFNIECNKVKQADEPPDFILNINKQYKYAIEVTESNVTRQCLFNDGNINEKMFYVHCYRIAKEIEVEAKNKKILSGTYSIDFLSPISKFYYKLYKEAIFTQILIYLEQTYDLEKESYQDINIRSENDRITTICSIRKINKNNEHIYPSPKGKFAFIHTKTNIEEVCKLLQHAINDKKHKLRNVESPIILLFYDSYLLTDRSVFDTCIERLTDLEFYHSIYVISGEEIFVIKESNYVN